jgi:CubicO group peptidase (beta-lactamase class C family)
MLTQVQRLISLGSMAAVLMGCVPAPPNPAPPDYWPTAGWLTKPPEEVGMDSTTLAQMVEDIQTTGLGLHSLLIVRSGYLVTEIYVYPYTADQAHWVWSVTKSVVGALVGIAIDQGSIKEIHQPLFQILTEQGVGNLDDRKRAIDLESLLTQTSGLDCHEIPALGEQTMQGSQNWVSFVADLPMAAAPGSTFNYCTAAAQLVSAAIEHATGMTAREYANQTLFAPLGIAPLSEERWPSDPQGVTIGGYGLAITPREMAKFGALFLNRGQWNGQTIVPADWVAASTASHANQGGSKEYGYMWWVDPQGQWFAALGRGGQHIFVYPKEQMVVVFTSDLPYPRDQDLIPLQDLLNNYILAAIRSDQPLPPNSSAQTRLAEAIHAIGHAQLVQPQPIPPAALAVSGKPFVLGENSLGWHSITFTFKDGGSQAGVLLDSIEATIGMDNLFRLNSNFSDSFPEGLRGRWGDSGTLLLEDILIGATARLAYEIEFHGTELSITRRDLDSGAVLELHGRLGPETE